MNKNKYTISKVWLDVSGHICIEEQKFWFVKLNIYPQIEREKIDRDRYRNKREIKRER